MSDDKDKPSEFEVAAIERKNRHYQANALPTWGYRDLRNRPRPTWMIEGIIQSRGLGLLHGDPGTYKTFCALDMVQSVAAGMPDWFGHRIDRQRNVLYVLAEGVDFLVDRQDSWLRFHDGVDQDAFNSSVRVFPEAVNILNVNDVNAVISTAKAVGAEIVVFDTYSRMIVGENENDPAVASTAVANLDAIQKGIDGFVLLLHHNSKEGKFRGSTVIDGALDVRIEATKASATEVVLNCRKIKNGAEFPPIRATMREVGTSVVPVPTQAVSWASPIGSPSLSETFSATTPTISTSFSRSERPF